MTSESASGRLTLLEQRAYIKVEFLRGKKAPEIHAALCEVNGNETVDRSTETAGEAPKPPLAPVDPLRRTRRTNSPTRWL